MLGNKPKFLRFIQDRKRRFLEKILSIPRSQIRIVLFLLQNGNRMQKHKLIEELLRIKYSDSKQYCYIAIKRACDSHVLVEDRAGYVSVKEPACFIFKIVRGDVLDNWKVLILPTLILTILFARIDPILTMFFGVASLVIVVSWFLEDKVNTVKF